MLKTTTAACMLLCALTSPATVQAKGAPAPQWAKMIECKSEVDDYQDFVLSDFQEASYKKAHGITLVKQGNMLINEYALQKPIEVFGYRTQRVAFTSAGVMAVLDETDAAKLAERLSLNIEVNTPTKLLATKTILETPPETLVGQTKVWNKISLDVSTIRSHPGKTLAGCSYRVMTKG